MRFSLLTLDDRNAFVLVVSNDVSSGRMLPA